MPTTRDELTGSSTYAYRRGMHSTDTYLAIGEVAATLGVTVGTVRNWDAAGKLRSVRTPGNQRRFKASDVAAILSGNVEAVAR